MSLKRIKTLALATAIIASAGIGFTGYAQAHVRHYGWHSGWHKDWHRHAHQWRRMHYGFAAPVASYGCGAPAVYGSAAPAFYGAAGPSCGCCGAGAGYYGYGGDAGLFGLGFPGGGLLGLGLGPF